MAAVRLLLLALAVLLLTAPNGESRAAVSAVGVVKAVDGSVAPEEGALLHVAAGKPPPKAKVGVKKPAPKEKALPAKLKGSQIGVSKARRNLKAVDKKDIHIAKPFKHSLSAKERTQVRQKLDRLRNEVITTRSALTHTFDRAAAHLQPFAGGRIRKYTTTETETFYRVYSGDKTSGGFLTKTPPGSRAEAKRLLNLPSSNEATKIQIVTVPPGVRLERSRVTGESAAKPGGWVQYRILPGQENKGVTFHSGRILK